MTTFRKSKKVGPFRVTLTPHGVSTSAGVKGARVSVNSKGEVRRTLSVPGTGVYDTKKVGGGKSKAQPRSSPVRAELVVPPEQLVADMVCGLPLEHQRELYEAFRADPDGTVEALSEQLADGGYPPHIVDQLRPVWWSYLHRWTSGG